MKVKFLRIALLLSLLLSALAACSPASTTGQVIKGDPRDYLLEQSDLPKTVKYTIPEGESFLLPNEMAVQDMGQQAGTKLINETQRVVGARIHFQSPTLDAAAPQVYVATVVLHQTPQGAQAQLDKYNVAKMFPNSQWKVQDAKLNLGDHNIVESLISKDQQGKQVVTYRIEFAYRNTSADVVVYGQENAVNLKVTEDAARAVLRRLQSAQLSAGPVPTLSAGAALPK